MSVIELTMNQLSDAWHLSVMALRRTRFRSDRDVAVLRHQSTVPKDRRPSTVRRRAMTGRRQAVFSVVFI